MKTFVFVVSAFLLSTPAFAQPEGGTMTGSGQSMSTGASETPDQAATSADQGEGAERRICRRVETATGSRMAYRRICLTATQWRNFNRNN